MKANVLKPKIDKLDSLCASVRELVSNGEYENSISLICKAMEEHPHAAQPHNLFGIVLEKKGDHTLAMKHFRAAWALDPTYIPASYNLNIYGTFCSGGKCAFDESDLPPKPQCNIEIVYDERGIGHVKRR